MIRILSDLHIESPDDPAYAMLLRWILGAEPGDELVLAGDIFDFLVGRGFLFDRYAGFVEALRQVSDRGVTIHYIEGNHDLNLRAEFLARVPSLRLHREDIEFAVGESRLYVAHGDLANRRDAGYRLWRACIRSLPLRALFRALPETWLDRLGEGLSRVSRGQRSHQVTPEAGFALIRPIYRSFAAEKAESGFDYVVLGHCHDLDEMGFQIRGRTARYMNVGFPKAHGSYVVCDSSGLRRAPLPR